jgi:hypothetical protein
MAFTNYSDPLYIDWHIDSDTGQKISIARTGESNVVTNSRFILSYVPDELTRVTLTYGSTPMTEIKSAATISSITEFKVDYTSGWVYVYSSLEGATIVANYYSRGIIFYPASRIWYIKNNDGTIYQTLQDSIMTVISGSTTYNPPSISNNSTASTTVTVTGAVLGDCAISSFSNLLNGIRLFTEITAENTATVTFINQSGTTIDLSSGTLSVKVIR